MLNWLHTQKAQGASQGWPTQEQDMTEDEVSNSIYRIQSVTSRLVNSLWLMVAA